MPAISVVVYRLVRWMDMPVPEPELRIGPALLMFIAFFIGASGEELDSSSYALDPMQARLGALGASLVLGRVGILWHLTPLLLMGRSLTWIAWWCLYTLAFRIFRVWLYNNSGKSVFAAALFHATANLAYLLFPVYGSHLDVLLGGLVMAGVAFVVVTVWGPKTLAGRADV